jgi:Fe-S cluster biosynthesis and repair protein YggX
MHPIGAHQRSSAAHVKSFEERHDMAHIVKCVKLGREAEGLDEPPFDTPLGQRIYENVSKQAWADWGNLQKMLLNEYRLQPWRKEHQEFIAQQMENYFFGEGATPPAEYTPENK